MAARMVLRIVCLNFVVLGDSMALENHLPPKPPALVAVWCKFVDVETARNPDVDLDRPGIGVFLVDENRSYHARTTALEVALLLVPAVVFK